MGKKKLTDKREAFCREYLVDFNVTQAAIRAGYSVKTAGRTGHDNLKIPEIQERIAELKQPIIEKNELTREWIVKKWQSMAKASMKDFYNDWFTLKEFDDIPEEIKENIKSITTKKTAEGELFVKIELFDKQKALEALERYLPATGTESEKPVSFVNYYKDDQE